MNFVSSRSLRSATVIDVSFGHQFLLSVGSSVLSRYWFTVGYRYIAGIDATVLNKKNPYQTAS